MKLYKFIDNRTIEITSIILATAIAPGFSKRFRPISSLFSLGGGVSSADIRTFAPLIPSPLLFKYICC